ncbi:hypothetical protein QBC38DRAFT_376873 [Podospora fimiseda]|uniref:Zn(2)-C6 fungal-type domain-containing protein n=1 Tax=Podospora fimiseda TaxID=252190 RepID=A0AAN6YNF9_9PEZI|nr:hypothetical protein QBC38DRAFT_376873 [Podospora fimiseda]
MSSISAIERKNPPPRKKSCAACIKSKRRCTLETPACQRCAQRGLDCKYPEGRVRTPRKQPPAPVQQETTTTATYTPVNPTSIPSPCSLLLDISFPPTIFNPSNLEPILDFPDAPLDNSLLASDPYPDMTFFNPPNLDLVSPLDSLSIHAALQWAFKHRLAYALDHVRLAPQQFVLQNQTPWSHPTLYDRHTPSSILDAQAACSLHLSRNNINNSMISRNIESRIQKLVSTPLPADSPLELIANCQALLLYQIMRILEGDFHTMTLAEQTTPLLEDAALMLMDRVIKFETPPLPSASLEFVPLDATRKYWEEWVMQESARRTFVTILFFVQTYRLLRGIMPSGCEGKLAGRSCVFTVGSGVWNAMGPVEFAKAWGEGRRWVILNTCFHDIINHARGEDLDTFNKMVLSSIWGIEETKAWLSMSGGCLDG